ncbi:NERD domain-containing protein [Sutcliffiella rhizosphaerae]|nr:NERD domain-containing protein [Sutcliffiella rhizosphaerae]
MSQIEQELAKRVAGYRGKLSMDYYLSFLDVKGYYIFHDLRLHTGNKYFQMDILILSANYLLILEIKNIIGTVQFENYFNQFIRTVNGLEEGFYNPIFQTDKQKYMLKQWLNVQKFNTPPIESLICFTNPQTIIRADSRVKGTDSVIHSQNLLKIAEMDQKHRTSIFTKKDLLKIARCLIKSNKQDSSNVLARFNIAPDEIIKGVHCPRCYKIPIDRKRGNWYCSNCKIHSKDAYIDSLKDHLLLFGPQFTHLQFKEFLKINSNSIASKLISSLNLSYSGTSYKRTYILNNDDFLPK